MNKELEYIKTFRQKEYVEKLINQPEQYLSKKVTVSDLRLICLYLRDVKYLKPKQRKEWLYEFVEKNDKFFNPVLDYKKLDRALKRAIQKTQKLKQISKIEIYQSEFDYIFNLPLLDIYKRLLFTVYCYYKLKQAVYPAVDNYYIPNYIVSIPTLKRNSKIKLAKGDTIGYLFYDLKEYLDYSAYKQGSIKANFIEKMKNIEPKGDKYEIKFFENVGMFYDLFVDKSKYSFCEKCGDIFKDKNKTKAGRNSKYCKDCSAKEENGLEMFICEECGEKYFRSSSCRRERNICDECYDKWRTKYNHSFRKKKSGSTS